MYDDTTTDRSLSSGAAADMGDSYSHQSRNSKSIRFCGICPVCEHKVTPQSVTWLRPGRR